MKNLSAGPSFPLSRRMAEPYVLSLLIAACAGTASLAGLFFPEVLYPTDELRRSFVSNDAVTLLIGLPILLWSLSQARHGRTMGLLFWPGALFYVTYNALAYLFAYAQVQPFSWLSVFYLCLAALSVFTITRLLTGMDAAAVRQRLYRTLPERLAGGVLAAFGVLFFFMAAAELVKPLTGQGMLPGPELAVRMADLLTMPLWVIGGALLWLRKPFGYLVGAGLLFQACMLFIGLLVFFILQPFAAGLPFPVEDFGVIFVFSFICFIPFGLFIRGIRREKAQI